MFDVLGIGINISIKPFHDIIKLLTFSVLSSIFGVKFCFIY